MQESLESLRLIVAKQGSGTCCWCHLPSFLTAAAALRQQEVLINSLKQKITALEERVGQ